MIPNFILLIALALILIAYLKIANCYFQNKHTKVGDITAFDLAKEITASYDEINIVQSKETMISKYNLKRRVIRLTPKTYSSNDYFSLAIATQLSGFSLANINHNQYLKNFNLIFPSIDFLNKSPILALLLSLFTHNIGDAKLALIPLTLLLIYQYFLIQIHTASIEYAKTELLHILKEEDSSHLIKILQIFSTTNTIFFITTLIFMLREILLILNF